MSWCWGRAVAVRAATTGFLLVAAVVAGGEPAAAQTPTVTVTPDRVVDGQPVEVAPSGFPSGRGAVVECLPEIAGAAGVSGAVSRFCTRLTGPYEGPVPPTIPSVGVRATFTTMDGSRTADCRTGRGCVVGWVTEAPDDPARSIAEAYAPIRFVPSVGASPRRELADGDTVEVTGEVVGPGEWAVAQCRREVRGAATPQEVVAWCGPATPATVAGDGTYRAELRVREPLPLASGPASCGSDGCVVVLSSSGEAWANSTAITFGAAAVAVEPATGVFEDSMVRVRVTGVPDDVLFSLCADPVDTDTRRERCYGERILEVDEWGNGDGEVMAHAAFLPIGGSEHIDCRASPCVVAAFGQGRVWTAPLELAPPPTLAVDPAVGLLDGQAMTVRATRLAPGGTYWLRTCSYGRCGPEIARHTASPDGTLEVTVPASQRFSISERPTSPEPICRPGCVLELGTHDGQPPTTRARASFAMAAGELSVTPRTGLRDGQEVRVTGRDLMSTYAGPYIRGFPTGGWALTQCDRAVLYQADLGGVFTHCAALPATRPVGVEGSTLDAPFPVAASITRILGGTTDCTAEPGACVVGLVRFEQDASLSHHLVPVTFDG